jgi:site-specific DNA-cytosine methylase
MREIVTFDLFSGIGGFALAARMANERLQRQVFRTVAFAEIDPFCRAVRRISLSGHQCSREGRRYRRRAFRPLERVLSHHLRIPTALRPH